MQCKNCGTEVNVLDTRCPACGFSLNILDSGPSDGGMDLVDRINHAVETELEAEMEGLSPPDCYLKRRTTSSPVNTGVHWTLGGLQPMSDRSLRDGAASEWETPVDAIQQMAQFVFFSSHVQANQMYRRRAAQTTLHYVPDDSTVNAFATDAKIEGVETMPPMIFILGGLARMTRMVAAALAEHADREEPEAQQRLVGVVRQIGERVVAGGGTLEAEESAELADRLSLALFPGKAVSYNAAMNMVVIAHELGHIALGHTLGQRVNLEISRNQEREADSFAASVASSSPFGDYIVAGGIFFWVIMAWIAAAAGNHEQSTHPHARERLMDYIRSNSEQAAAIGIDNRNVEQYLP